MSDLRSTRDQLEEVVQEFYTTQLALRGHEWHPPTTSPRHVNGNSNHNQMDRLINGAADGQQRTSSLDTATKKRIMDTLISLNEQLMSDFNDRIVEIIEELRNTTQGVIGYSEIKSIADEMFIDGPKWSII